MEKFFGNKGGPNRTPEQGDKSDSEKGHAGRDDETETDAPAGKTETKNDDMNKNR